MQPEHFLETALWKTLNLSGWHKIDAHCKRRFLHGVKAENPDAANLQKADDRRWRPDQNTLPRAPQLHLVVGDKASAAID